MPELPEVETVRRGLEPVLAGHVIARADVRRPDLRWPFPPGLAARLTGARVLALRRRSKYLLADLDRGETLIVHLGMSGRAPRLRRAGRRLPPPAPGAGEARPRRPRPRRRRARHLQRRPPLRRSSTSRRRPRSTPTASSPASAPSPSATPSPPPTSPPGMAGRITPVKAILLDQRVVAGLGNIYVCEALWRARISPLRDGGRRDAGRDRNPRRRRPRRPRRRHRRRRLVACATTARPTASSATSSTPSPSTAARASPAPAATAPSPASSSPAARASSARPARPDPSAALPDLAANVSSGVLRLAAMW